MAGQREVRGRARDEAERVHELVNHAELEVPWWAGRRDGERVRVAGGSAWWRALQDRKSTRLNSSHDQISYAVFCLKKKNRLHYIRCSKYIRCLKILVLPKGLFC